MSVYTVQNTTGNIYVSKVTVANQTRGTTEVVESPNKTTQPIYAGDMISVSVYPYEANQGVVVADGTMRDIMLSASKGLIPGVVAVGGTTLQIQSGTVSGLMSCGTINSTTAKACSFGAGVTSSGVYSPSVSTVLPSYPFGAATTGGAYFSQVATPTPTTTQPTFTTKPDGRVIMGPRLRGGNLNAPSPSGTAPTYPNELYLSPVPGSELTSIVDPATAHTTFRDYGPAWTNPPPGLETTVAYAGTWKNFGRAPFYGMYQ